MSSERAFSREITSSLAAASPFGNAAFGRFANAVCLTALRSLRECHPRSSLQRAAMDLANHVPSCLWTHGFPMRRVRSRLRCEDWTPHGARLSEPLQPSHDELSCTSRSFPDVHLLSIRFGEVNRPRLQAGQPEVVIATSVPREFVEKVVIRCGRARHLAGPRANGQRRRRVVGIGVTAATFSSFSDLRASRRAWRASDA